MKERPVVSVLPGEPSLTSKKESYSFNVGKAVHSVPPRTRQDTMNKTAILMAAFKSDRRGEGIPGDRGGKCGEVGVAP